VLLPHSHMSPRPCSLRAQSLLLPRSIAPYSSRQNPDPTSTPFCPFPPRARALSRPWHLPTTRLF
jgi:hypothetical protein